MNSSTEPGQQHRHTAKHPVDWCGDHSRPNRSVLPWLLTPQFETIRQAGPQLERLPEPPAVCRPIIPPGVDEKH